MTKTCERSLFRNPVAFLISFSLTPPTLRASQEQQPVVRVIGVSIRHSTACLVPAFSAEHFPLLCGVRLASNEKMNLTGTGCARLCPRCTTLLFFGRRLLCRLLPRFPCCSPCQPPRIHTVVPHIRCLDNCVTSCTHLPRTSSSHGVRHQCSLPLRTCYGRGMSCWGLPGAPLHRAQSGGARRGQPSHAHCAETASARPGRLCSDAKAGRKAPSVAGQETPDAHKQQQCSAAHRRQSISSQHTCVPRLPPTVESFIRFQGSCRVLA